MKQIFSEYFRFVQRFLPEEVGSTKIGLDIGGNSCKFVELIKSSDHRFEIQKWGIEPVVAGDISKAVQTLWTKYKLTQKNPVTSVFGKGTLIRYIDMPRMSLEDLRKSFSIEVDKYFPFDQNTIYTDCAILDPKGKDKKMAVLVAAVKKEMIDERIKLITGIGLEPQQVMINAVVVANAFQVLGPGEKNQAHDKSKSQNAKAILDIGSSVSNLMILKDDVPRFTRDIFIGCQEIINRIAHGLGVSSDDAEKLMRNPGHQQSVVFEACESTVMNFISEIRLSLDYFITEKNIPVDLLLLTGGGSLMPGLESTFEKGLDLPVRKWNFIESLNIGANVNKEELEICSSRLGVAIGLAISQYD